MSYTVLARRYRSQSFDDVVGQEAVAKTLKNAIATDRVAHAYLFSGTRGVGKTTMARILAKALNCLDAEKPTPAPCCKCESCLAVAEGEDIDVQEIDGASNTGVEHIRELRQNAIYRPARARFKIYIIDEVHMLSVSAFNALLKTLEEPPEHVKFIMATTEPNKVLPTILSRCQRFDFRNIQPEDIAEHLKKILKQEKITAEPALLRRIARLARGSMRDALSLLDQLLSSCDGKLTLELLEELLGVPRSVRIIELVDAIAKNDLAEAIKQVDSALGEGLALDQLAQALQGHFRDLMVLRNCGAETELLEIGDNTLTERMDKQAKMFDDATLVYNITVMEELHRAVKSSGSGRVLLEAAIVRLAASERFSDTRVLLEQLQQMLSAPQPVAAAAPVTQRRVQQPQAQPSPATQLSTTPAVSQSPPKSKTAPKPKAKFSPPKTITLDYLQQNWQQILDEITELGLAHLVACLKLSQPVDWQSPVLTIGYQTKQNGMRSFLADHPDHTDQIEATLTDLLSRPVKLNLATLDEDQRQTAAPPANNPTHKPTKKPPGAKPSQQEINNALNEPKVRQVQEILGGKVRHVERIEKE